MTDHDWVTLVKQQDQYVLEQNRKQKQRKLKIQQIYKNQLQKMILNHQENSMNEKQRDKLMMKQYYEKQQKRIQLENYQRLNKYQIKQKIARDNIMTVKERRKLSEQQLMDEKKIYASRFQRAATQAQQQIIGRQRNKQQQKYFLGKAYQQQIKTLQSRKEIEKLEDEKFSMLMEQIQRKKEQNRRNYFNKLRNGYRQNPEVYQLSATILENRERQRQQYLQRLLHFQPSQPGYDSRIKQSQMKLNKTKQISIFNKFQSEIRLNRQRHKSIQQVLQYRRKFQTLQQELKQQKIKQLQQKQQVKRKVKIQLQKQIDEKMKLKQKNKKMSSQQYKINKSGEHMASLPGLSKDFTAEKHQKIVQTFLLRGSQPSFQYKSLKY